MKQNLKRLSTFFFALCMILPLTLAAQASVPATEVTVLFTHDLHSHLLPSAKEGGGEYGGYARLMTLIQQQRANAPEAILVDGGDFSMGSLFQTAYSTAATELRMMGAMGYDATTFGNHEFDYLPQGLANMLNVAADCGEPVPAIVNANYLPPKEGEEGYTSDSKAVWNALDHYGVEDYIILHRNVSGEDIYFVLFGLTGFDSHDCAPNSGMILQDPVETAQRIVEEATAECWALYGRQPLVIALSHSGTEDGKGEDYELARQVDGIDLIISGHTHTTLHEPIQVNETYIVSAGEYGKYLGVVHMRYRPNGEMELTGYDLIPVDETVEEEPGIAGLAESSKASVEETYLSKYGMSFDQILTHNAYPFDSVDAVYDTAHESTLGNVFSDAYKRAVEIATGERVDMAVTAAGVIRESIPVGDVTVSDIFNAASLGVGTEGELVAIYLTGTDLKCALEVDASVYPLMHSAQLFPSGVEYSFNTRRMIFNKVDYAMLRRNDGTLEEIEDGKLYRVVTGMYVGQMLGSVEDTSMGLLNLTPRDRNGYPIDMTKLSDYVVKDKNGNPVKEWYAIASYLESMGTEMDPQYAQPDGRKVVYSSLNPVDLLRNANKFTYILLAVLSVLILLTIWVIRKLRKKVMKKKQA